MSDVKRVLAESAFDKFVDHLKKNPPKKPDPVVVPQSSTPRVGYILDKIKDSDGNYPSYAWPGGYPMYYLFEDGEVCCPDCANGKNGSDASETTDDPQWKIEGYGINYEDPDMVCAHCGKTIEAAYV